MDRPAAARSAPRQEAEIVRGQIDDHRIDRGLDHDVDVVTLDQLTGQTIRPGDGDDRRLNGWTQNGVNAENQSGVPTLAAYTLRKHARFPFITI